MIQNESGFLATFNDDGEIDTGDTLSNEFFMRIAWAIKHRMGFGIAFGQEVGLLDDNSVVIGLYDGNGYWKRSPDDLLNEGKFTPSRDQWIMPIIWCALTGQVARLKDTVKWIVNNQMRYPNGDIASGEMFIMLNRVTNSGFWQGMIPLFIWDLWMLFGTFNRCGWLPRYKHDYDFGNGVRGPKWLWGPDPDDVGDDKVHIAMLAAALVLKPTFLARLATRLYFKYRKPACHSEAYDQYAEIYKGGEPMAALFWYFRKPKNNDEIAVEWTTILAHLRKIYG